MPLLTHEGWKPIEAITAGELVRRRDEGNLAAPLDTLLVGERFVYMVRILRLKVRAIEIQSIPSRWRGGAVFVNSP